MISPRGDLALRPVPIDLIDFNDSRFKISKNIIQDDLVRSIESHGVIEEPVLIGRDAHYTILTGHNRLNVLKNAGFQEVFCRISPVIDPEIITNSAIIKSYHGEIGPVGKIRFIKIMKELDPENIGKTFFLGVGEFNMPEYVFRDDSIIESVLTLPQSLLDYADSREIGFKTIRDMLALPAEAITILSRWIDDISMRVNIFKDVVEILGDLSRQEGALARVREIELKTGDDPRGSEMRMHSFLRRLRYPEYSEKISRVEPLISALKGKGIGVDFPQYFEGDRLGITLSVAKREGAEALRKIFGVKEMSSIQHLLDLL